MINPGERKALTACAFVGGCLLLAPRQWVSAGILFAIGLALGAHHLIATRLAARAARGAGERQA